MTRFSSTSRFSNRVEDYIKYRPHYPGAVMHFLEKELRLSNSAVIADIGSGTGISSEMFLRNGNTVFAVEPNREMREAAERLLGSYPGFRSIDGTAEDTTMQAQSIDMIIAGQAFHWFDVKKSREEFRRMLKPQGYVVLMWNDRKTVADDFLEEYEALLNTLEDYRLVNHKNVDEKIFNEFFGKGNYKTEVFDNYQEFDFEGLKGRLNSSSYVPVPGDPAHEPFMHEMKSIFDKHNSGGKVRLLYDTRLFYGRLQYL